MFEVQQAAAGEWAVVAAGGRALLVATADRERLLGYHDAVRSGFAETLDALVASGLSRTPAFALLDASQQTLLLAVRGETGARIHETGGGQRELRASGVSSWVEVQLSEAAQVSLDVHNAANAWNKALLDNAARPSGALVYKGENGANLSEEQFERLRDELAANFSGTTNAGRPLLLDGGLSWQSMSMTPRDMDFQALKDSAAREIALAFGVPPMLLGIPGDNTYANMAEANRTLWRHTIVPLVRRVTDDLSFWLAPAHGGRVTLEPDFDGVEALAEDQATRWARIGGAGFLSDDEKREMLGFAGE